LAAEQGRVEEFLIFLLAEALDPNGNSDFQLKLVGRKPGKPINRHDRALRGHRAAAIVEKLVQEGVKQEAGIAAATEQTGLSRAEIFTGLVGSHDVLYKWPEKAGNRSVLGLAAAA